MNTAVGRPDDHVSFETAAQHATSRVPIVGPRQRIADVRALLGGQRYDSAAHVVVCEADRFRGVTTIENVLAAPADATVDSVMDADAPCVGPRIDQEVAAWRAVQHQGSALSVATLMAVLSASFDTFGFDPAFGSGPLATVVQDLLSIWIYLAVTTFVIT